MQTPNFTATLALLVRNNRIALGEQLQGRFMGFLNGPGGKREEDETLVECILREIEEEMGLRLTHEAVGDYVARADFYAAGALDFQVFVYRVEGYEGELRETVFMRPAEYPLGQIPYDRMMEGDRYWLPLVLKATRENRLLVEVHYRERGRGLLREPSVSPLP